MTDSSSSYRAIFDAEPEGGPNDAHNATPTAEPLPEVDIDRLAKVATEGRMPLLQACERANKLCAPDDVWLDQYKAILTEGFVPIISGLLAELTAQGMVVANKERIEYLAMDADEICTIVDEVDWVAYPPELTTLSTELHERALTLSMALAALAADAPPADGEEGVNDRPH